MSPAMAAAAAIAGTLTDVRQLMSGAPLATPKVKIFSAIRWFRIDVSLFSLLGHLSSL